MITLVLSNDFRSNCSTIQRKSFDKTLDATKKCYKIVEKVMKDIPFSILFTREQSLSIVMILINK